MDHLPLPIILVFIATALVALVSFVKATGHTRIVLPLALVWMALQSALALSGSYLVTNTLPPRLLLFAAAPPLLLIAVLFASPGGRRFLDGMSLKWSVLIHTVRVLVEITLYWLFLYKQVPVQMTFEGGNIDILAGLSAPLIWWAYSKGRVGKKGLLIWNALCLLSVLNAVVRAQLSAPFRFQQFAFDQPTVAILYFPFVLLLTFIVPVVLLCQLSAIRKLMAT